MTEEDFRREVESLDPEVKYFTKIYRVVISEKNTYSGKSESFEVRVYIHRNGGYSFQWTEWGSHGKSPRLPSLNETTIRSLAERFHNPVTFLTEGFANGKNGQDTDSMVSIEDVLEAVTMFGREGIQISF